MTEPSVLSPAEAAAATPQVQAGKVPQPAVGWHAVQPVPGTPGTGEPEAADALTATTDSPAPGASSEALTESLLADVDAAVSLVPRSEQDGWREEIESIAPHAIRAGISPGTLGTLVKYVAEVERTSLPASSVGGSLPDPSDYDACSTFMEQRWGAGYKANQKAVYEYVQKLGPEAVEYFSGPVGNRPGVLEGLLALARGDFKLSPAQAQKALENLMADKKYLSGDKSLVSRSRLLSMLASGNAGRQNAMLSSYVKPAAPAPVSKGPSVEELQAEIIQTSDRETRTRLIGELRKLYQTQEG